MADRHSDSREIEAAALERRGAGRGGRRTPATSNEPATVTVDAVPALILKQSQRFCKDGRPFSLAALDVLEYEQVLNVFGAVAAEQLDRLGRVVCTSALRGTDRLCFVEPGHILILLPDTDGRAAKSVLERIAQSIASAKLHYKNKPLRASGAFHIVSCDTTSDTTEMLAPDLEALLHAIGYKLDEKGNLFSLQSASLRLLSKKPRPFSGSFTVWSDRYVNIQSVKADPKIGSLTLPQGLVFMRAAAFDQWQAGKQVNLKLIELTENNARFDLESLSMVARRARVLQQIDYPGVSKLLDFHAYEERSIYLVENPVEGKKLATVRPQLETAIEWCIQICNTLIYLQGLIPPLIPPPLQLDNFVVLPDNQLLLTDYEMPYLLAPLMVVGDGQDAVNIEKLSAPHNRFGMENLFTFIYDLISRARDENFAWRRIMADEPGFEKVNSIFKLRSQLNKLSDKLKAGAAR